MDMESQKILFALSTPMEIRNECWVMLPTS